MAGGWRIVATSDSSPVDDIAVTVLVVAWVGVLGSFAGLLLNPTAYPLRHGVAILGAAVALTVAHDVGSFAVGSTLGRHRLAPRVSPGKTIEGLIGGTILTLGVAAGIVAHVHPFNLADALALGGVVAVFAPWGDLFESVVKRDLGLKDMGRLLPAHGGVLTALTPCSSCCRRRISWCGSSIWDDAASPCQYRRIDRLDRAPGARCRRRGR